MIGCVKCGQGGGGAQKSPKFCGRHMYMAPRHFDSRHLDSTKIQNATVCELLINGGIMDFSSVIMPHLAEILWKQDVNFSNGHLRRSC